MSEDVKETILRVLINGKSVLNIFLIRIVVNESLTDDIVDV